MSKGKYCLLGLAGLFALCIAWYPVDYATQGKGRFAGFIAAVVAFVMLAMWAWFNLAITAKRFHDLNMPGWLAPAIFVPVAFVVLCILSGTRGPNKYGPPN